MSFVIYAIRHKPTGRFYIGSTTDLSRRMYQWRGEFKRSKEWIGQGRWRSGAGINQRMCETSLAYDEYEFVTIEALPDGTPDEAARAENRAIIQAAMLTPALLLNVFAATARNGAERYGEYRATIPAMTCALGSLLGHQKAAQDQSLENSALLRVRRFKIAL